MLIGCTLRALIAGLTGDMFRALIGNFSPHNSSSELSELLLLAT